MQSRAAISCFLLRRVSPMSYSIYVLNLDRHPNRLKTMAKQLSALGMPWQRFTAIDGSSIDQDELDALVTRDGPIPRMPSGAQAVTASHLKILEVFLQTNDTHAVVLEDDAVLAADFAIAVLGLIENKAEGLVNINRQPPSGDVKKVIVGKPICGQFGAYTLYDLKGVHYGAAGYVIDRSAAKQTLSDYNLPNMPIDHIYFNPNVSALFGKFPIRQMFPAVTKPADGMVSSIQMVPVEGASHLRKRLKRLWAEVAIAPRLLAGVVFRRYQVLELRFGTNDD